MLWMRLSPHFDMTHHQKPSTALLLVLAVLCSAACTPAFAAKDDDKRELYRKGMDAVNAGDAISARDAFCSLAGKDTRYADAANQCAVYVPMAQRALNRYKINYAEGVTLLASYRYDEAELKLKNVRAGEYAEEAQKKLRQIPTLKATHPNTPETDFERMLHVGDSGASFQTLCDGNERFEQYNRADEHTTQSVFCGGWVRGASQILRAQVADSGTRDVCIPVTVTVGQQTKLLLQYIQRHPAEKDASTSELFMRAMKSSYPCRVPKNDPDSGLYESE
jgi:hypothetical protein